jgi:hypothetical protein
VPGDLQDRSRRGSETDIRAARPLASPLKKIEPPAPSRKAPAEPGGERRFDWRVYFRKFQVVASNGSLRSLTSG